MEIKWPGRGVATPVSLRGMSDYTNMNTYKTPCGRKLKWSISKRAWQAQFRCFTSSWHRTPDGAIADLEAKLGAMEELTRLSEESGGYDKADGSATTCYQELEDSRK